MPVETYLREEAGWRSLRDHHILLTDDPGLPITHGSQINEFNTGWARTGATLTTVIDGQTGSNWHTGLGNFYITGDDVVIEDMDIPFVVRPFGNNITLRRCRVRQANFYAVLPADLPTVYTGLTMEDCELDGLNIPDPPTIAAYATADATFRRCDIHGFGSSGPRLSTNNLLTECYIHDFPYMEGNHLAGTSANDDDTNVTVERCKIMLNNPGVSNCIGIYLDFGTHDGIYIRDNYVAGGSYAIYAAINVPGASFPSASNVEITGNILGRDYHPLCGFNGPVAQWRDDPGCVFENNVWGPGAAADHRYATGEVFDIHEIIRDL